MPKKPIVSVGDVFAMPQDGGEWGACQVVRVDGKVVEAVALDHLSDALPTLASVTARPLVPERYLHRGDAPARVHAFDALPGDFVHLGALAPVLPATPPSRVWASWQSLRDEAALEARWRRLPADARRGYQEGAGSNAKIVLQLPSGPLEMARRADTLRLVLDDHRSPGAMHHAGPARELDWRAFDALPCLTHVVVCGDAPGLLAWLATRPLVHTLTWIDASVEAVDLRGLSLTHVDLRPRRLGSLRLADTVEQLDLAPRDESPLTVEAAGDGAALRVQLRTWEGDLVRGVRGLAATRHLHVSGFAKLDLAVVVKAFPALRDLTLRGAPGRVRGSAALASLSGLARLQTWLCVGLDVDRLPPVDALPSLESAHFSGLSASDAASLRARWGRDRRVGIRATIPDDRVFAEADHPLLRWVDDRRKVMACSGYTRAARAIGRAAPTHAAMAKALRVFTAAIASAAKQTGPLGADEIADVEVAWARLTAGAKARAPDLEVSSLVTTW